MKSGANGYLTKDTLGDELLTAVQSALASRALRELTAGAEMVAPATEEADVLTRVCEMLDRKLFEATVINEITAIATKAIGLGESAAEIMESLSRLISFDAGSIVLMDPSRMVSVSRRELSDLDAARFREHVAEHLARFSGGAVLPASGAVRALQEGEGEVRDRDWETLHSVPLRSRGQFIGMMVFGMHAAGAMTDAMIATTRTVTPAIVSVLESVSEFDAELTSEAAATFQSLA